MSTTHPPPPWLNRGPLWIRIHAYALTHHHHGHTPLTAGELQRALGPTTPSNISRAINTAIHGGWLHPCSSARCLVLPGHERHPCPAVHRGDA